MLGLLLAKVNKKFLEKVADEELEMSDLGREAIKGAVETFSASMPNNRETRRVTLSS